ncbi:hypothetical protein Sjap_005163 [Stephania japonica]|uniref:Uncharacterized protein n=1 Tax=Stephania japonica TaxID=461633 RepID=A0AAP0K5Y2_9MAGN
MDEYLSELEETLDVSLHELDITIAHSTYDEVQKDIEVISKRPEELQKESNDDAIVEEKVVFGDDGRVLEVAQLTSKPQVLVVVSCDESSSTKMRGCRDEVDNYLIEKGMETKVQFRTTKHFYSLIDDMDEELVGDILQDSHGGVFFDNVQDIVP